MSTPTEKTVGDSGVGDSGNPDSGIADSAPGTGLAGSHGAPAPGAPASGAPASIVACPNGPLLVRGNFEIVTPDGVPVPRDRETVALCRCGASAIKPYCDGTHKLIKFDTARRRPVPGPARTAAAAEDAAAEEDGGSL